MMQAQVQRNVNVTGNIFGTYILKMRTIPGRRENIFQAEKEEEKKLFEMVDEYIEQA